jgi:hypothetical protein
MASSSDSAARGRPSTSRTDAASSPSCPGFAATSFEVSGPRSSSNSRRNSALAPAARAAAAASRARHSGVSSIGTGSSTTCAKSGSCCSTASSIAATSWRCSSGVSNWSQARW